MNASKKARPKARRAGHSSTRTDKRTPFLPALVAAGGVATVFANPAAALELGEVQVNSTLGQPLRASIAYALNANEEMYDFCVFLNKGLADDGIPTLTRAKVSIVNNQILLSGDVPVREPLLSMRLTVDCPYTAHLAREYTLMVSPSGTVETLAEQAAVNTAAVPQQATATTRSSRPLVAKVADESAIVIGSEYRVQIGDSLSGIASRIADRPVSVWPAVQTIFEANPQAFISGDINQLRAGSVLQIPAALGSGVTQTAAAESSAPVIQPIQPSTASENDYAGYSAPAANLEPAVERVAPVSQPTVEPDGAAATTDDTSVLASGNKAVASEVSEPASRLTSAEPGDVFESTEIPAGASVSTTDAVPTPVADPASVPAITAVPETTSNNSWMKWLGGTGTALIIGLLLFGRKLRGLFGGGAENRLPTLHGMEDQDDLAITQKSQVVPDVEFSMQGSAEMELDADLGAGTGFQSNGDVDLAQDFGFAGTIVEEGPLDLEIPEHAAAAGLDSPTDIIPPQRRKTDSIVDSEILPSDDEVEDEDYDLSMIVDATKQALDHHEGTAKDLMAVRMPMASEESEDSSYTVSKEIDYKILEQDYEEELTATQALNADIAKAALELAERMDADEIDSDVTASQFGFDEVTAQLPQGGQDSEVTAELTARLPTDTIAENDEFLSDLDDTGVNEELTAELPLDGDLTIEMDIESGTIDTKKLAG